MEFSQTEKIVSEFFIEREGEEILKVNDNEIKDLTGFFESLEDIEEGDDVKLETNETVYSLVAVKHPSDGRGYLGIHVNEVSHNYVEGKEVIGSVLAWLTLLVFWIFTANLGVGLFNVLPMLWPLPLDGGKMFYLFALKLFKDDENKAKKLTSFMSLLCLVLILISLSPLLIKFFNFVFQPFFALLI